MRQRSSPLIVCRTVGRLLVDALRFMSFSVRSRSQLAAENLFLRKQLALYRERNIRPRRADNATRVTLVVLAQPSVDTQNRQLIDTSEPAIN